MKRNDLLSFAIDAVLACLMAIAGVGCLITGFSLHADMNTVALTALLFAALGALCVRLRRGWLLVVLTILGGALVLGKLDFQSNFYSLLHRILNLYHSGYGWGIPEFLSECNDWDLTLSMQVISACCALYAGIYLSRCLHSLSVLAVLLPVMPCIVVTDTVPSSEYLLLAILTVALLALTDHARRADTRQANRLTALLLIPLILAGTLLFARFPEADYRTPDLDKGIISLMDTIKKHIPFLNQTPSGVGGYPASSATVRLNAAGPRTPYYNKLLEVTASQSGPLYLRGRSYIGYTGLNWEAWQETDTMHAPGDDYLIENTQTIQIKALKAQIVTYFPYYPGNAISLVDGTAAGEVQDTYFYRFKPLRSDWQALWREDYAVLGVDNSTYAARQEYLQLPAGTAASAVAHLKKAGLDEKSTILQIVHRVQAYVQGIAEYDLDTAQMPADETDFALWFLDEGETGYCIHFATAATVLLRAAGVPARYVEGYLVDAKAGQATPVRGENAHAWVEYYMPAVGWVILEATPSEGLPVQFPTEPTEPPQTTQPTQPTEPPQTTQPTRPTLPNQTTPPTEPTRPTLPNQTTPSTTPTEPPQTTAPPSTEPAPAPQPVRDLTWLKQLLKAIGTVLAALALVLGQWRLRLMLRRKRLAGREFVHIRRRWRYACLLARLCRHQPPKVLLELLKKEKFSRNGLNDRDLRQFDRYYAACIRGLQRCPWPLRIAMRLILAAW